MTKPVTGVGLMRLWEQGRFGLDEPLAKYLPEYGATKVFTGMDPAGKPILKAPDRPILIRDILRHTAGFAYWDGPTYPEHVLGKVDPLNVDNTLAEFSQKMATIPLMYEPGTQWRYSAAADVQARLIEKLSGQPFETYMREQVLAPLKMTDSAWTQPEARFSRLATPYEVGPDHKLRPKSLTEMRKMNFSDRKLTMGGAGLATTLDDYMRFARMLLGHGSLDGVRILKPSTVRLMTTDQLDPQDGRPLVASDQGQWRVRLRPVRPRRPAQGCGGKSRLDRRILLGRRLVDIVLGRSRQRHGGGLPGPDGSLSISRSTTTSARRSTDPITSARRETERQGH